MAEDNDSNYKTITRIIEMHGSQEWLEAVLANSRIPIQGVRQFQKGMYIKSGIVIYQSEIMEVNDNETSEQMRDRLKVESETVKTVQFKRPGE
jgi:hypothetical protein